MKEERRNQFIHKLDALGKDELELLSQMLDNMELDNRQDTITKRENYERLLKKTDGIGCVQMMARDSLTLKNFPVYIQGVFRMAEYQKILINSDGEEYVVGSKEEVVYPCLVVQEKPEGNQSLEYLEPGKSFYIGDTFFYMFDENRAAPDIKNLIANAANRLRIDFNLPKAKRVILKGWYYNFLRNHKDLIVEISNVRPHE